MARSRPRLFVSTALAAGVQFTASPDEKNYLFNVLRMANTDELLVFDGVNGEWLARIELRGRKSLEIEVIEQTRPQTDGPPIDVLFAPLKHGRLDYLVQKLTELGARRIQPVLTERTNAERIKLERMQANVKEAAEQCGVLRLPKVAEPVRLREAISAWDPGLPLVFCDEAAPIASPIEALCALPRGGPVALLVGPEGGFSPEERNLLIGRPFVTAISLGPRIMRADTAAVAALALLNAVIGDWR